MKNRIYHLQNQLEEDEAMLIISGSNRYYYTDFMSSAGTLFVTQKAAVFLTDFRYFELAERTIKHCNVVMSKKLYDQLNQLIEEHGIKKILLETFSISLALYQQYQERLNCEISLSNRLNQFIRMQRSIKTPEEIKRIKEAQKITDDTFSYILNRIEAGRTERDIMLDMEFYLRKQGSKGVAFEFIVVSGKNSSLPHGRPTDKVIEKGDFVTMDFGAVIKGYRSDMTRTVAVGEASEDQKKLYYTVLEAQNKAFEKIRAGVVCKEVDRAARDFIAKSGYDGCFGHALGHSVGIDVHESPNFNTSDESVLEPGMILSVEPGIYLQNQFGARIEDLVLITKNGYENLTKSPKELIIV